MNYLNQLNRFNRIARESADLENEKIIILRRQLREVFTILGFLIIVNFVQNLRIKKFVDNF